MKQFQGQRKRAVWLPQMPFPPPFAVLTLSENRRRAQSHDSSRANDSSQAKNPPNILHRFSYFWQPGDVVFGLTFLLGLAAFSAGLTVIPDPRGFGTHEQFGMPSCGFPADYGIPCPTCGVTTAFAYSARLQILESLHTQLFGTFLFWLIQALALGSLYCLIKRRSPLIPRFITRSGLACLLITLIVLAVGWWVKIQDWRP